jgi:hypothetical protein
MYLSMSFSSIFKKRTTALLPDILTSQHYHISKVASIGWNCFPHEESRTVTDVMEPAKYLNGPKISSIDDSASFGIGALARRYPFIQFRPQMCYNFRNEQEEKEKIPHSTIQT